VASSPVRMASRLNIERSTALAGYAYAYAWTWRFS
jgi:hypothetical protein